MGEVIQAKVRSAINSAKPFKPKSRAIDLNEDSLATLFAEEHEGRVVYAHILKQWLMYEPETGTWRPDNTELVLHWVRLFVRHLNTERREKWAKASVIKSVETLARRDPQLAIRGDEFDADPWLLGTPGGVIDLRMGESVSPSPAHYVSKRTSVAPVAKSPELWLRFLADATQGNTELMDFLQRLAGYCLTGETREENLTFLYGLGGNGKGVFMNTLRDIFGEYAKQASMQVLLASKGDRHPTELADLYGARLVMASESPDRQSWDEERVKALTGRDAITARFMGRDFFTYVPQFKLVVASNHKPRIKTVDDAWRRRLHLVPFTHKPERPDPGLKDRLRDEYPAILQWMIEGAEWWIREGLTAPSIVIDATADYFREEDVIGLWFEECCIAESTATTMREELYRSYKAWCAGMGHAAAHMHAVTRWFTARGYNQNLKNAKRPIMGVVLRPSSTTTTEVAD